MSHGNLSDAEWVALGNQAMALSRAGEYAAGVVVAERALKVAEESFGPEHPNTAHSLYNLASLHRKLGHYSAAEPLYQRAVAILEKECGRNHPDVANALSGLALLHKNQGQYSQSEALNARALEINQKAFGEQHASTAHILNNLAEVYRAQGQYSKAEPLFTRALTINERLFGIEHPALAMTLNNLAMLYHLQGHSEKAAALLQRAHTINEKTLGPEHPATVVSLSNLASMYSERREFVKAEPLFKRVVALQEKLLGPEHPMLTIALNNLASVHEAQGNLSLAEQQYSRALSIYGKIAAEHPELAGILNNLGAVFRAQGRYEDAEKLLKRALAMKEKALGPDHPALAPTLNNLALLYCAQHMHTLAEALFVRELEINEKALGPEHPGMALILNNLGELYNIQGQSSKADALFKRALAIKEKSCPAGNVENRGTALNELTSTLQSRMGVGTLPLPETTEPPKPAEPLERCPQPIELPAEIQDAMQFLVSKDRTGAAKLCVEALIAPPGDSKAAYVGLLTLGYNDFGHVEKYPKLLLEFAISKRFWAVFEDKDKVEFLAPATFAALRVLQKNDLEFARTLCTRISAWCEGAPIPDSRDLQNIKEQLRKILGEAEYNRQNNKFVQTESGFTHIASKLELHLQPNWRAQLNDTENPLESTGTAVLRLTNTAAPLEVTLYIHHVYDSDLRSLENLSVIERAGLLANYGQTRVGKPMPAHTNWAHGFRIPIAGRLAQSDDIGTSIVFLIDQGRAWRFKIRATARMDAKEFDQFIAALIGSIHCTGKVAQRKSTVPAARMRQAQEYDSASAPHADGSVRRQIYKMIRIGVAIVVGLAAFCAILPQNATFILKPLVAIVFGMLANELCKLLLGIYDLIRLGILSIRASRERALTQQASRAQRQALRQKKRAEAEQAIMPEPEKLDAASEAQTSK